MLTEENTVRYVHKNTYVVGWEDPAFQEFCGYVVETPM